MKYVKQPILVDAIQWMGGTALSDIRDIKAELHLNGDVEIKDGMLRIPTTGSPLEIFLVDKDYIIREDNKIYNMSPELFHQNFNEVELL